MLKATLAIGLVLGSPAIVEAKTFKLGGDKPAAEITLPDGWETEEGEGALEATPSDKGIYLSADVIEASEVADAGKETAQFLAEQKIKVKPETKKVSETKVADLPSVDITWDATDEDGPTKITLLLVKLNAQKVAVLTYWRSPPGEKDHGAEVEAIEKSLKPLK